MRRALGFTDPVMATASSIVDRLDDEFKRFQDIPPQVGLVIRGVLECRSIPREVDLALAPLYVAMMLADAGTICIIVSSVKPRKWLSRVKKAGLDWEVEGFTPKMSDLRAQRRAWFEPLGTHGASHILELYDAAYPEVLKYFSGPLR